MIMELVYRTGMKGYRLEELSRDQLLALLKETGEELLRLRVENRKLDIENFNLMARGYR